MRAKLPLMAFLLSVAVVALLAGCGDDNDETTSAGGARPPRARAGDGGHQRDRLRAGPLRPDRTAGPVSFKVTNDGAVDHNLEVEAPEGEQELEQDLAPGESGTLTVDLSKPGKFEFYCPVGDHRDRGMEGEITVADGGGSTGEGGDSAGDGGAAAGGGGGGYGY